MTASLLIFTFIGSADVYREASHRRRMPQEEILDAFLRKAKLGNSQNFVKGEPRR